MAKTLDQGRKPGSGRPPGVKSLLGFEQPAIPPGQPAEALTLPNLSGDHSKGRVRTTPTTDLEIANKKYVDDAVAATPHTPEGTAVKSTGEGGATKFLREDGDDTCSWQATPAGSDEKVKIDVGATADYLGAAFNDGVLRSDGTILTYTDGGNFITLTVDETQLDHDALANTHNLTTDIDHDQLTNTHNLTTDIDHDQLTNTHNLTTDIDHDQLTNTHNNPYTLDEIANPAASKTFNFGNNKSLIFTSTDNTPGVDQGVFNFEGKGAFSGDLVHIHQHTGNPGATNLLKLEAEDADVVPLRIAGIGTFDIIAGAVSFGNITTSGTVDGIDIATDVAANTLKDTNVTTNLSMGTVDGTQFIINSSDGTNVSLPLADTNNWGIISDEIFDEIAVNTTHAADNSQAHTDYLLNSGADIAAGPLTITADNSSADQAYVPMVLYNTDDTPPAASNYPIGTLYVQYTA